jgi:hypothetical protein
MVLNEELWFSLPFPHTFPFFISSPENKQKKKKRLKK